MECKSPIYFTDTDFSVITILLEIRQNLSAKPNRPDLRPSFSFLHWPYQSSIRHVPKQDSSKSMTQSRSRHDCLFCCQWARPHREHFCSKKLYNSFFGSCLHFQSSKAVLNYARPEIRDLYNILEVEFH